MTTTQNPTATIDPVAEDTAYVAAVGALIKAQHAYDMAAFDVLRSVPGIERRWETRRGSRFTLDGETVDAIDVYDLAPARYRERFDAADDAVDVAAAEVARLRAVYAEHGWSRFWFVPGGHLHSSTDCQTCNRDGNQTRFCLVPELSGSTEADAVAEMGAVLCTVCYPTAPVEQTDGSTVGRRTQAERDARAAEKATKQAAKLAKAIHADGSPIYLQGGDAPTTIIAVQRQLSAALADLAWYGADHPSAASWVTNARTCAEALAARLGGNVPDIVADSAAKAAKRMAKEADGQKDTLKADTLAVLVA